ncbi:MAG: hypothetical protein JXQ29_08755 [Planctomycetes bacterium]|nr:hypothetical protein [Planctomycetota bacterium]
MRSTAGVTDGRSCRSPRLARVRVAVVVAALLSVALEGHAQAPAAGPRFEDVKKQIDTLKRQGLVSRKARSLFYLLDPDLNRDGSRCYAPPVEPGSPASLAGGVGEHRQAGGVQRVSLADAGVPELAALGGTRDGQGNVKAYGVALALLDELFKEFCFSRQAKTSLEDFLKREGGLAQARTDPLLAVGLGFWVEREAGARPQDGVLVCRLEIRAFKVTVAPIRSDHSTLRERADFTHLELVFQDSAFGRVALKNYRGEGEAAMRSALCAGFLDKVVVNLGLSPALQAMLTDAGTRRVDIKGASIARRD